MLHKFSQESWVKDGNKGRRGCEGQENRIIPAGGVLVTQEESPGAHPFPSACLLGLSTFLSGQTKCISLCLHIVGRDHRPGLFLQRHSNLVPLVSHRRVFGSRNGWPYCRKTRLVSPDCPQAFRGQSWASAQRKHDRASAYLHFVGGKLAACFEVALPDRKLPAVWGEGWKRQKALGLVKVRF
jgi:hypothetical protein